MRARYYAIRTVQMVVTLWLVTTFLFVLFRSMPGSMVDLFLFQGASPEAIQAFEEKWGLNDPLYVQYWSYMVNLLQFDAGVSLQHGIPVYEYTRMKIFNSFILIAPGVTIGYVLGSVAGTILGTTKNERFDQWGIAAAIFVGTIPSFFLAILAIVIFASSLGWVPTGSMVTPGTVSKFEGAPWWRVYLTADFAIHYVLPVSVIGLRYTYLPTLLMRTSVAEVMGQGFYYYNRITGLPRWRRMYHLARHASLPVITFYPLSLTRAIGGLVLIELVFNWPGIGNALVDAVIVRDLPVVQFVFLLVAAFIIVGNFVVDVVYGILDPRVTVGQQRQ